MKMLVNCYIPSIRLVTRAKMVSDIDHCRPSSKTNLRVESGKDAAESSAALARWTRAHDLPLELAVFLEVRRGRSEEVETRPGVRWSVRVNWRRPTRIGWRRRSLKRVIPNRRKESRQHLVRYPPKPISHTSPRTKHAPHTPASSSLPNPPSCPSTHP